MAGNKIDGKGYALKMRAELKERVVGITEKLGRPPGLAVVLVGEDAASQVYVRNKELAATKAGMKSSMIRLAADASMEDVLSAVDSLNADETIDGFLVQLPLPGHLDEKIVTDRIDPVKDADGLHPTNMGRLLAGIKAPRPCTPSGCIELLKDAGVEMKGAHAVVIGRSTIVGKPMAMLLLEQHSTVTICHSRTKNVAEEVGRADIVIAAVGRPEMVKGEWLKEGAAVIDVGINRVDGKLVGDVDYEGALERAACVTPVPGGVGPMTVAMLLKNTVDAAERKI
ncbi:MAG: bifunctional methylenetetrahydrofolate dehydrogenase/methenyltetrahydrofolate cyclohydrolase FolD [Deltaproteobacteria bacterium]|jgi:methylenetetrahydrofolate dehydrogenase (NADP+) / methenyltetrahydrofolate cyclohydrolase|nr:bifunctional methylenetetrahydrofolate dehydrogenase/methenyltetrahydrofolate cyclohydrolase FolD [Deltaproteobacteria bacterium]MBT6433238.1 bifunctional methylenetetrahydrofolate dehydrogenase/methenyltetrahydrofolate cyclohydrolase FolD [Deltaproteobacteria bacterium]MBT6489592.1 bifunctional methylenetetrahydrofolate dehydrogenase/methenyltetrahydrofolate cyclohydrolase FolD [Deltaproteobacteria bacterium]